MLSPRALLLLVALLAAGAGGEARAPYEATVGRPPPGPGTAPAGMVWIPGGEFSMGTDDPTREVCGGPDTMPDARPIHRVYVDAFWMDATEVTNEQFAAFVSAP